MSDDLELRAKQLATCLGDAMQCTVCYDWKSTWQRFRFYFERQGQAEWTYIIDFDQEQLEDHSLGEILAALEEGQWKKVLQTNYQIYIPLFRDGKFVAVTEFFPWPPYENQRGSRIRHGLIR